MPKIDKAHYDARKKQIINAADTCFSSKGIQQTTMHDICRQANLSIGAVYSYFDSKEQIIIQIAQESLKRNLELISGADKLAGSRDKLCELADVFFSMLEEAGDHCVRMDIGLWDAALTNDEVRKAMLEITERHRDIFAEIVRAGQEKGEIDKSVKPESVAMVMISTFKGLVLQKGICGEVDVSGYVDTLKKMIGGLLNEPQV